MFMTSDAQSKWTEVDDYISETLLAGSTLQHLLVANKDAGLPQHDVSPAQGRFLQLIAQACGAKNILELGTLGGYSTAWLAGAIPPSGRLISLEENAAFAATARRNLESAGFGETVSVRIGPALDSMEQLIASSAGPFDFIFIDADKARNVEYLKLALQLSRPGTLIIADNTVRNGDLVNQSSTDPSTQGVRRFHEALAQIPSLLSTTIQTVGCKGYDGFTLVLVTSHVEWPKHSAYQFPVGEK